MEYTLLVSKRVVWTQVYLVVVYLLDGYSFIHYAGALAS